MSRAGLAAVGSDPRHTALRVSGLDQATFEWLIANHGQRFSAFCFGKCPRISDLSPLETLPRLTQVAFFWNQRAARLWDFSRTPALRGLRFEDFRRLQDLGDLRRAVSLQELRFGDGFWQRSVFASLEPVGELAQLRSLDFDARRLLAGGVEPLARLQCLEKLAFPSNLFTTRQVAWLRARLPDTLKSRSLDPVWRFPDVEAGADGVPKDVLLVGRGKPFVSSVRDVERIARHVAEFENLVAAFRGDPARGPD